jgi:hypothetical protein
MFNFIKNLLLFGLVKAPINSSLYLALKYSNLYLQIIFFKTIIDEVNIGGGRFEDLWLYCFLIILVVCTGYTARLNALSVQRKFLVYMMNVKLEGRKGLGWLRPITVELWNVLDSLILLFMLTLVAIYLKMYLLPIGMFLFAVISWVVLSKKYISAWERNTKKGNDLLFWRLGQQNLLEVFIFGGMLFFVLIFLKFMPNGPTESEFIALFIIILRVILSTISRQISILPRVSRYFSELPNWPEFWGGKKWV